MSWKPKYTITDKLIFTIRQIGEVMGTIKALHLGEKTLARLEIEARELSSHASTSIEGNPLLLTDVKRLLKKKPPYIRDTEREILNYNEALEKVYTDVKQGTFTAHQKTLEKIQGVVVKGLMNNRKDVGRIRKNHVVIRDPRRADAVIFMPPDFEDVPKLLKELMLFVQKNLGKIDPIILAGLFHRQCVIIHPFMDGNGRSTRLFTTALLRIGGLDIFDIFSFENYYNRNVTRYFKAVGLFGDYYQLKNHIDFTQWLEYFADGILDELHRVRKIISGMSPNFRLEKWDQEILMYIKNNGSITQREYGQISNRSLAARKKDFQKLVELNLIKVKGGGRSTYYVLSKNAYSIEI